MLGCCQSSDSALQFYTAAQERIPEVLDVLALEGHGVYILSAPNL